MKTPRGGYINVEFYIEPNILLAGNVYLVDDSFDHAFGTQKEYRLEVDDMQVFVFVGGYDDNLTEFYRSEKPKRYAVFKEHFLDYAKSINSKEAV